ncbi:hypothetical protein LSH36_92g05035 [Paralvinella palmiformis]|uniref:Uncharacterized protein n=1 Tax=Paralvinella palmiformis TaxID=53620 RepID=A0AAD9K2J3_9ANNE|nr:hypothetical protein LSH36_92g05035 [Paralvinella palmiformis]
MYCVCLCLFVCVCVCLCVQNIWSVNKTDTYIIRLYTSDTLLQKMFNCGSRNDVHILILIPGIFLIIAAGIY